MKNPMALLLLHGVPLLVSAAVMSPPVSLRRGMNAVLAPRHCERDAETVATVVETASKINGDSSLQWGIVGGTVAWSTCRQINHHAGTDLLCTELASLVAAITYGAVLAASKPDKGWEGAEGGPGRRALDGNHHVLFNYLQSHGFEWQRLELSTISKRHSVEAVPDSFVTEHFVLRAVHQTNSTLTPADIYFTTYANRTGTVRTIHVPVAGIGKRHDGAGFKVSWKAVDWNSQAMSQPGATPVIGWVAQELSTAISRNWVWWVDNRNLEEWIGYVRINYIMLRLLSVGLRIIPELTGFGENYEDVGICGDINKVIHDEL